MRAFRATPHSETKETPNYLMLGRELRLPDTLIYEVPADKPKHINQYVVEMEQRLKSAHEILAASQWKARQADFNEAPLYKVSDQV